MADDIRWVQRYENYRRSVKNLSQGLDVPEPSKLEQQGIVKAFELAYELAWKTLQDYLIEQGIRDAVGPKGVLRRAFREGLIGEGDGWNSMDRARNEAAHLYDEERAVEIVADIHETFFGLLSVLDRRLSALARDLENDDAGIDGTDRDDRDQGESADD